MNRHIFHHQFFLSLALVAAAATAPLTAQTMATNQVVPGCLQAAPANSLRTAVENPSIFRQDQNGIWVVEIESAPIVPSWVAETSFTGFAGQGYYRWGGRNLFNSPGSGVLTYRLWCDQPARYRLQLHNRHDHPDSSEENDCWMSVNGSSWRKIYSNDGRNERVWNWHTRVDPGHGWMEFNMVQGLNELRISGRSTNFKIDRFHIFPPALGRLEDLNLPQSNRMRERAVIGSTVRLQLDDPQDDAGLPAGSTNAFLLLSARANAAHPCGLQLPGLGANGGVGELLLDTRLPISAITVGSWQGPGSPVSFSLPVPNLQTLVGATVYTQGLLVSQTRGVLTERLDLHIGDY